jgi:hypothetical protein
MLMVTNYFVMLDTLPSMELFRDADKIFSKITVDDPNLSISTSSRDRPSRVGALDIQGCHHSMNLFIFIVNQLIIQCIHFNQVPKQQIFILILFEQKL